MNAPATLPWSQTPAAPFEEDVEGCEFVNGQWRPKHPPEGVERVHDREGAEFVKGEWREKHMSATSDRVGVRLAGRLDAFVSVAKLGRVQGPECAYQCFPAEPKRVRKPDASFIMAGRLPQEQRKGNVRIAPDFAAEVISPTDEADTLNEKVQEYLAVGIKLVWLVYPDTRSVWIFRPNGSASWVVGTGELSGEEVIPGFSISLDTLFADD